MPSPQSKSRTSELAIESKVADGTVRQARLQHLTHAAAKLMLKRGFHRSSVRQIADATGWPMGTLYLYISKKEDVLYLIARRTELQLLEALEGVKLGDDPWDNLEKAIHAYYEKVEELRDLITLNYREVHILWGTEQFEEIYHLGEKCHRYFVNLIQKGINAKAFCDVDARLTAEDIIVLGHVRAFRPTAVARGLTLDKFIERQIGVIKGHLMSPSKAADTVRLTKKKPAKTR